MKKTELKSYQIWRLLFVFLIVFWGTILYILF